jgi:[ribosomal protein S18]-alanine N-acetyltransferase
METTFRNANPDDTAGMARVYLAAFPESVRHFFGDRPPAAQAVADLLLIPLLSEPACGTIALRDGVVAGYCLAPSRVSEMPRVMWRGHAARMLGRWLRGAYGIGLDAIARLARNSLLTAPRDPHHLEAHILSIAVHPDAQGMGLGRELLRRGMSYLEHRGARRVRLEVRPDNTGALRLYESHGFVTVGRTRDSQGDWLIMIHEAGA